LVAGLAKAGPDETLLADPLRELQVIPEKFITPTARVLPAIEIGVGVGLLAGYRVRAMAASSAFLYSIFTVYAAYALRTKPGRSCACFGPLLRSRITKSTLIRNALMAIFSLIVSLEPAGRRSLETLR
jgi:hypothetical protein